MGVYFSSHSLPTDNQVLMNNVFENGRQFKKMKYRTFQSESCLPFIYITKKRTIWQSQQLYKTIIQLLEIVQLPVNISNTV